MNGHSAFAMRCLTVVFVVLAATWMTLDSLGRSAPTRPDAAVLRAVDALVSGDATAAYDAVPASFQRMEGYAPAEVGGLLLRPTGDCSGPNVLPADFAAVCKRHDLGYDLLRVAARDGGPLPGSARRAIDAQLSRGMAAVCATRPTVWGRLGCRSLATVATIGVGINSVRQHWSTPGRESARSWGALAAGLGAVVSGLGLLGLLLQVGARRLRPVLAGWVAPVGRRADAGWLVRAAAVGAGLFPSELPHSAAIQAVTVLVFVAVAEPFARRLSRRPIRARVLVAGLAAWAGALGWEVSQQDAVREASGLSSTGSAHWLTVAAVVCAGLTLPAVLRLVGRVGLRRWRPIVAVVAAGTLVSAAAPAQAAPSAATSSVSGDYVLLTRSPVGAVRAYAAIRDGESLTQRADRAAAELVAAGGLTRHHVVLMLPTGSGWIDPAAVTGLEDRFGPDVAEVGIQSTAVPSWVAFLAQRGTAADGARALYTAVEERIGALPVGSRPQLHVWGESLGATSGQSIFTAPESGGTARATVCSALWVGSPGGHRAGLARESLVSNPTDPVVHTSWRTAIAPRGDGRPWLPIVSFVQSGVDFVSSRSGPVGTGHVYGPDQAAALQTCGPGGGQNVVPVSRS